jgi:glycosyltransferase involved in cell wall biosynthesis
MRSMRLTAVLTHPIQYYAPWFRYIAAREPRLQLTVVYASRPTPTQQGAGFGRAFEWDVPLTEGYEWRVVRRSSPGERFDSDGFLGLDVRGIGAAIEETRPDVVLVPGWYSLTLVRALAACRRRRIPVVYRGDTHLGNAPGGWRGPAWRIRTRALLGRFDAFLSPGSRARDYLDYFGVAPWRIFDSPHCVDNAFFEAGAARVRIGDARRAWRDRFDIGPDAFVVIFAGKLEAKKRPLDLVRAVAQLPGATLLMAGDGRLEAECRREAARLQVQVRFAGFLNQSEMPAAYGAGDCLALPSDWAETWGLVVNEALAAGIPCVTSDRVGCAPDLVTDGTGASYAFGDIGQLAGALRRVRDRLADGFPYPARCREMAAAFSFGPATEGLVAACDAAVRRVRPSPRVLAWCGHMVAPGGLERMTFQALASVREAGGWVHCIVNSWGSGAIAGMASGIGASVSRTPVLFALTRRIRDVRSVAGLVSDVWVTSVDLWQQVRRVSATHVFVSDYTVAFRAFPALMACRLRGLPVVLRLGNAPEATVFYRRLWRYAVNAAVDRFVCNSRFTESAVLACGIGPAKVAVVRNTLPARTAQPPGGEVTPTDVLFVGQIIPEKGVDLLLEAAAALRRDGLTLRVGIVGSMEGWVAPRYEGYRERLLARSRCDDLAGAVVFFGWREDVPALMAASRVHCCPSRPEQREAFGIVVLEAKSAGLPSIVTDTGALPELIRHQEDGWVCRDASAEDVAEGLRYFLSDASRLEAAGAAARRSLDPADRARFAREWQNIFGVEAPPPVVAPAALVEQL